MDELNLIKRDDGAYLDSRDVAEVIGKPHNDLMKTIRKYNEYLTAGNISLSEYFINSTYFDSTGRELPCYLLSKMGCEMVANKLTGEKGVLFTAAYVKKFNDLETAEREDMELMIALAFKRQPRLGEVNACTRLMVRGMKGLGATPEEIMFFLNDTYDQFKIKAEVRPPTDKFKPRWRSATEIAAKLGIYSQSGKPHNQAVSFILNEIIDIDDSNKSLKYDTFGGYEGFITLYDDLAVMDLIEWLRSLDYPKDVKAYGKTYHLCYSWK